MNGDLRDLYQEIILDHNRSPRNFRVMPDANRRVSADNPLCGDSYQLFLKLDAGRIVDISFQGSGCAISKASVSMLSERLMGASIQEAENLFESVHALLTGKQSGQSEQLGELEALAGVRNYPIRVKCATLGWHALKQAIEEDQTETVTTE